MSTPDPFFPPVVHLAHRLLRDDPFMLIDRLVDAKGSPAAVVMQCRGHVVAVDRDLVMVLSAEAGGMCKWEGEELVAAYRTGDLCAALGSTFEDLYRYSAFGADQPADWTVRLKRLDPASLVHQFSKPFEHVVHRDRKGFDITFADIIVYGFEGKLQELQPAAPYVVAANTIERAESTVSRTAAFDEAVLDDQQSAFQP